MTRQRDSGRRLVHKGTQQGQSQPPPWGDRAGLTWPSMSEISPRGMRHSGSLAWPASSTNTCVKCPTLDQTHPKGSCLPGCPGQQGLASLPLPPLHAAPLLPPCPGHRPPPPHRAPPASVSGSPPPRPTRAPGPQGLPHSQLPWLWVRPEPPRAQRPPQPDLVEEARAAARGDDDPEAGGSPDVLPVSAVRLDGVQDGLGGGRGRRCPSDPWARPLFRGSSQARARAPAADV